MRTCWSLMLVVCLAFVPILPGCGGVTRDSRSSPPTDTGDDGTEDEKDSRPSNN
jgi:hypothetical protein